MRLIKFLLCISTLFICSNGYTQGLSFGIGYGTTRMMSFEFGYIAPNKMIYDFKYGIRIPSGTIGKLYTVINWDEFPQDVYKDGNYWTTYDISVGRRFNKFFIAGLLGYSTEILYRNCYDDFHILGDNGYYHKQITGGSKADIGIEAGVIIDWFKVALSFTSTMGINANIGGILFFNR